jgi:hypothetical protein
MLPTFECCARPMVEVPEDSEHGRTGVGELSSSVIPFPRTEGSNIR